MRAMKKSNQKGQSAIAVKSKFGKGQGKAGNRRGNGKMPAAGTWMFVPNRGAPLAAAGKGSGKATKSSKIAEKLAKVEASRKVWIGGLKENTSWKELQKHVEEVLGGKPDITEILPKGKACLAFKSDSEADSAISIVNGTELKGRAIQADVWTQKEKKDRPAGAKRDKTRKKDRKSKQNVLAVAKTGFAKRNAKQHAGKSTRGDPKMREKLDKVDNELKVWVGGLATKTKEGGIRKLFASAGNKPHLINLTGKDRACLSFKTAEEASNAIAAMNGKELDGATLEVDVWTQVSEEDKAARREERKLRIQEKIEARKAAKEAKKLEKAP
jgi:RNA recognition motif-containing protein